MRIVYLHQYFRSPREGGGTRSWEFARRWARWGHDVHLVTTTNSGSALRWQVSEVEGFRLHSMAVPYGNEMGKGQRIRAFMRFAVAASYKVSSLKADAVYATSTPLTIAVPAMVGRQLVGSPYVLEVRDLWPDVPIALGFLSRESERRAAYFLESQAYKRSTAIIAISPGMAKDIRSKGVPAGKVHVVTHGCDPELFQHADVSDFARDYPWTISGPLVVYTGTLGLANGVDYLVDLACKTRVINPSVRFAIIGKGAYERELVRRARDNGTLNETLFFLGGRSKEEVAKWLNVASISMVILKGPRILWKDAGQNKFFDAISAGTAVACNNNSWQSQIALENGVGVRLDPDDIAKAAGQLCRALSDSDWIAGVPQRCRALWQGDFNRDLLAQRALDILVASRGQKRN